MDNRHVQTLPEDVRKTLLASAGVAESLEREDLEPRLVQLNMLNTPLTAVLESNAVQATAYEHEVAVETNRVDMLGFAVFRDGNIPRTVEVDVQRIRVRPMIVGHRITVTELAVRTTANGVIPIDDLVIQSKIAAVSQEFEYMSIYGDSTLGSDIPESPNNLERDGIINIIKRGAPQNVIDAGGAPLDIQLLWKAETAVVSTQAYANPSDVFMSYIDKVNLQNSFYQIARVMTDQQRRAGLLGADAQTYIGVRGEHTIHPSQMLGDFIRFTHNRIGADSGDYAAPPETWNIDSATVAAGNSTFAAGTTLRYAIKVRNFHGVTAARYVEATTTADGDVVQIALSGITNAVALVIYRDDAGTGEYKFYRQVRLPYAATTFTFVDDGYETIQTPNGAKYRWKKIPGTGVVFGIDRSVTTVVKWIGMEAYRLPPTMTHDWAIWKIATAFSRAPSFNWLIVNVGQTTAI